MSGTCKYCGFSGTNDEMEYHAGEMCNEFLGDEDMIDDERCMTPEEIKWQKRLVRCLNDMPENIEICVEYSGCVQIRNLGACQRYFEKYGHTDNVPSIGTIMPKTSRRIDGRDSSI